MRKWLVVLVAALGLVGGVQAADGWGIYSSNKLWAFNGVGASYQVGITRFNLGASLLYVIPLGLQGGVSLVLPLGQQGASAPVPYAGAGVEGDLWLIGNEAGFLVYPHGLLGLELVGGTAIELRLGYLVFAGQSSAGSFAFGFGLRNPLY